MNFSKISAGIFMAKSQAGDFYYVAGQRGDWQLEIERASDRFQLHNLGGWGTKAEAMRAADNVAARK